MSMRKTSEGCEYELAWLIWCCLASSMSLAFWASSAGQDACNRERERQIKRQRRSKEKKQDLKEGGAREEAKEKNTEETNEKSNKTTKTVTRNVEDEAK